MSGVGMSGGDVPIPCWGVGGGAPQEKWLLSLCVIRACMYYICVHRLQGVCVMSEKVFVESVFFLVPSALPFALLFSFPSRYICQCAVSASRILLILISPPCYPCSESEMFLGT